ncbi:COR domain-containing protein [Vibrio splendidus]|uniref:COR domain-containing protein n=1 Tax=Vibrio splendidus TaxID=29497 RepID=UPI000D3A194A|nr:COR domain-containing protein [Vibrio splendidus]PTP45215.1 hypothetical protein CWN87_05520 [Vibrio splendidus]
MEKLTNLCQSLPELSENTLELLQKFIINKFDSDFSIEHNNNIDFSLLNTIENLIETQYYGSPNIAVINNKLISVQSYDSLNHAFTDIDILWLEQNNLLPHFIHVGCWFNNWTLLGKFNNLISIRAAFNEPPANPAESGHNPFPLLQELFVKRNFNAVLLGLSDSVNTIEKVVFEAGSDKIINVASINSLVSLQDLDIKSSQVDELSRLECKHLNTLILNQPINLNELEMCPNIALLIGDVDTSTPQTKGPSLRVLSSNLSSRKTFSLTNIDTQCLETLYLSSSPSIMIEHHIPTLKQLHIRKSREVFSFSILEYLPNLVSLDLHEQDVDTNLAPNWKHENITSLGLQRTNVSELSFIRCFTNLKRLNANSNQITNIEPLISLEHLNHVNVQGNNILDVPVAIAERFQFHKELLRGRNEDEDRKISLGRNPLISPPMEIVERGADAVKPYFESMVGETEELNEAKIVFLGNGEVGKTSLMKALSGEKFNSKEKITHGINIKKYCVPINERYSVEATIWDFGGQQIMHATHQLFLSRRCVYVLVINDRKDDLQQDQKIEYWLQQVQTYGGDSKVIIVRNKLDMCDVNNLQEGKLKEKFPNLLKVEGVSCADGTGIEKVRNLINAQVAQLPMRKVKLASNWIQVKNEIKALSYEQDHLPLSAFTEICCKHGINNKEAQTTLRHLLHDLSVVIAFEELADFDMGILNPHWITDGIYTIINSDLLASNKGYIKLPEAQEELDHIYPGKYAGKARFIVESMMQFELCHPVGSAKSKTYLVPNLLPTEVKSKELNFGLNTIRFIFKYENLLPPALFPKLLVRLSSNISADRRWRTGAVLSDSLLNVQALIEEDSVDKVIKIVVTGDQARDFFSHIRQSVRSLNGSNSERLGVQELIPLPRSNGHTVSYGELIGHELDNIAEYYNGTIRESFSVATLLSGIESREETDRAVNRIKKDTIVNVNVKTGDNIINNTNTNSNTQDQTQTAMQSQQVNIKVELKGLKGSAENLLEDLRDDAQDDITDLNERKRFIRECDKVEKALGIVEEIETEDEANQNLGSFARIKDFLENSLDKTGNIGQTMELLGSNIGKVRDLAKKYNKVAGFFGLPSVPEALL